MKQELSLITDSSIVKNYHPDYHDEPGNLFRILTDGRYARGHGKYFIVTDDADKYLCSAGWNEYDLDRTVALLLTRMYVAPRYRTQYILGNLVLPGMIDEAIKYQRLWVTMNDYNRSLYRYFERASENKRTVLFNDWPDIYRRFKPIGKRTVYYTEQWTAEYDKHNEHASET
jgi:hypothetical protein